MRDTLKGGIIEYILNKFGTTLEL